MTITKTDITGAKKLPGALIEVYDADGNTIYREYTNEKGEIPNIPVVPGTYTFKETYAPSGYALNVAVKTFTVTADGKVTGDTVIRDELNKIFWVCCSDRKYFSGASWIKISDNEHSASGLGNSEILAVIHHPFHAVPQLAKRSNNDGESFPFIMR